MNDCIQQQIVSVMDQNQKYQYNFQYSLANYQPLSQQHPDEHQDLPSHDEETILRRSNEIVDFRCFLNKDTEQIIKTLFTHFIQLYGRIAVRLYRICDSIYQNMDLSSSSFINNFQESLDYERQKLVQNLGELSKIFYDEKEKYLKLISLCIAGSIFKILTLEKEVEQIQFETIFHTVYWEITGTHSTSQMLKKLLGETFNGINFHNYLINEKPPISYKTQSVTQSFVKNSVQLHKSSNFNGGNFLMNHSMNKHQFKNTNQEGVSNSETAFSKKIQRKEKFSKQNSPSNLNPYQTNPLIDKTKGKPIHRRQKQLDKQSVCKLNTQEPVISNQKGFNFRKDRTAFFQNFSKTQSNKKAINDFGSSNKKPTFASYLEQKKLQF